MRATGPDLSGDVKWGRVKREDLLKLHSDQTHSVSVDLHQRRLNAAGVLFSFDNTAVDCAAL